MLKPKDLMIISSLRNNARESLTQMSKKTKIPISTLYEKIKNNKTNIIKKHTAIIDFTKLGFSTRAQIILRVNKNERDKIKEYLLKTHYLNSLYKINNGYDFLLEAVFRNIKEMEDFMESIDEKFKIKAKQVYYIVDDIKREAFLCNNATLKHLYPD